MTVEIYTRPYCCYCERVRELLRIKGVPFTEYPVSGDPTRAAELRQRGGGELPAIFVAGGLIGGCDELFALDERGALDPLITPSS